jgi:hypothetical protein
MLDPLSAFPNVSVDPEARMLLARLSPGVRRLIGRLIEVMARAAEENAVPISKTDLSVDHDPEEATEKIEIRQWVRGPEERALEAWDKLGHAVDDWVNGLSDLDAEALTEHVTFVVYPSADHAAA